MVTKKENLKDMSIGELEKSLIALTENLRVIRFKAEGSKSKNVKEAAAIKKQIAKVNTAISAVNKAK